MEKIELTARFDLEGRITPLNFIWNGRSYRVEGTGRRWVAKDGIHILVMVAGNQTFQLIFNSETNIWNLVRSTKQLAEPHI